MVMVMGSLMLVMMLMQAWGLLELQLTAGSTAPAWQPPNCSGKAWLGLRPGVVSVRGMGAGRAASRGWVVGLMMQQVLTRCGGSGLQQRL